MSSNTYVIEKTVEITVARMANTNLTISEAGGKDVAAFMQAIYDKLSELVTKEH
ncbi:MAG: hypothetical protein HDR06_12340 [Lachnospiraceae bacterium]|nr:hypothetical protein [Lachnospiraceae bacterium]